MRAAILAASILGLAACNMSADAEEGHGAGHGQTVRRDFNVGDFNRVSLAGAHDVIVTVGGPASVRAEGDSEVIDRLDIRVDGGELRIGSKNHRDWSGFGRNRSKVTIHVTVPELAAASIGGSGDMRIDKVEGGNFAAAIGGSGDMEIGSIRVGDASFSIAGSGAITAAGNAGKTDISIAGSGDINTERLESRTATISVVGSGDVRARAMETADVSIAGSGDVVLSGPGKCHVRKMGSGNVRCES